MLNMTFDEREVFDEEHQRFITYPKRKVKLEHSLVSISKWEAKWKIPFYGNDKKTPIQELDYIRCMAIGASDFSIDEVKALHAEEIIEIYEYMQDPMSATKIYNAGTTTTNKKEILTSEVIYANMFICGIDIECQKWHINRLLKLINVVALKNSPSKKMTKTQSRNWAAQQNAERRAKYNSKG